MLNSLLFGAAILLGQNPGGPPAPQVLPPAGRVVDAPIVFTGDAKGAPKNGAPEVKNAVVEEKKEEEKKDDEKKDDGPWRIFPDPIAGFKITGFIYGTGNYNSQNNGTRYNGPLTMSDQTGAFLNQFYLSIDRGMEKEFGIGGNVSFMYGNDYNASQSFGWELNRSRLITPASQKWNSGQDYGLAIPQLYAEVGTTTASLMVGHFWTPIGYNVVPATGNFFNTQPYSFMHGQPFDHWGAMAKFNPNDNFSGYFGVVNGINALDRERNSASLLFGGKYTSCDKKFYNNVGIIIGQEPENLGTGYGNRSLFNNVTYVQLNDKFEFVNEITVGIQNNHGAGNSTYYGISPYLFYKLSDNLKAGTRLDWFYDPGNIVAGIRNGNPNVGPYQGTFYSFDFGLNWTPNGSKNLMVRPEIRYDMFGGNGRPFNAGTRDNMLLFMLGAYYQF